MQDIEHMGDFHLQDLQRIFKPPCTVAAPQHSSARVQEACETGENKSVQSSLAFLSLTKKHESGLEERGKRTRKDIPAKGGKDAIRNPDTSSAPQR